MSSLETETRAQTGPGDQGTAAAKGDGRHHPGRVIGKALLFILKVIVLVHLVYIVFTSTLIIVYKVMDPPFTVLMPYRVFGYGWKLEKPMPVPLKKIPPYIQSMLVSVEDGKFYEHHGIDMAAFKRAKEINARVGKPLYGGSTLTMQVARTLFLVPEKSYVRKYFEVITALELELFLPKDRILELYFGYAEWGKGIFGIEAAARHYYGMGVGGLNRDQAARLIALLSSPIKYNPNTLTKSGILRERYAYLTRRFVTRKDDAIDENRQLPLPPTPPGAVEPGTDVDEGAEAPAAGQAEGSVSQDQAGQSEASSTQGQSVGAGAEAPQAGEPPAAAPSQAQGSDGGQGSAAP
ncbi:MAG: transglycosylase domain-containing protein [Spirochaetaceae bacterium]|nr:transglycosylase domain-containing protein [Spirochaetaceae bacterium]